MTPQRDLVSPFPTKAEMVRPMTIVTVHLTDSAAMATHERIIKPVTYCCLTITLGMLRKKATIVRRLSHVLAVQRISS